MSRVIQIVIVAASGSGFNNTSPGIPAVAAAGVSVVAYQSKDRRHVFYTMPTASLSIFLMIFLDPSAFRDAWLSRPLK
jgi:hypothetical protein